MYGAVRSVALYLLNGYNFRLCYISCIIWLYIYIYLYIYCYRRRNNVSCLNFRLPVLAGAAGALGGSYCSPYIALDNGYFARSSGQTSSSICSK